MQKIEKLNHIRAIACLLVVIGHSELHTYPEVWKFLRHIPLLEASVGVPLFFILSGFLFAHLSHNFRYTFNFKQFIYNRVLRIFPLVVVFLLIATTHAINKSVKGTDLLDAFTVFSASSFFRDHRANTGVIWSVNIEFIFYLMVPFIVHNVHKKGLRYIFLTLFFTIAITMILPSQDIYRSLFFNMFLFLSGMLLSPLYEFVSNHPKKNYFIVLSSAIFISLVFFYNVAIHEAVTKHYFRQGIARMFFRYLEISVTVGLFFIYIITPLSFGKPINKFLNFTAKLSFSIYLIHLLVLVFITGVHLNHFVHNPALLTLITFTLIIGGSFILAMTSYYMIEQPFLEKKVSYLNKD